MLQLKMGENGKKKRSPVLRNIIWEIESNWEGNIRYQDLEIILCGSGSGLHSQTHLFFFMKNITNGPKTLGGEGMYRSGVGGHWEDIDTYIIP